MKYGAPLLLLSLLLMAAAEPPPSVTVTPVEVRDVTPKQTYVGQVQAIQSVNIVSHVQAYIEKIDFTEGSSVARGQTLFELQKGPYQAALKQTQGSLAQAKAALENAKQNYERDSHAGVGLAVTEQKVQQDVAARDEAAAQVQSAQGALENAAIDLSYCTVTSPIAGKIGRALITKGNLVSASSGSLATVVQMDPIRVYFAIPDAAFVSVEQRLKKTREQLIASLALTLRLPDGSKYPEPGKVEFVNNHVDPATGTLTVWGRFANPDDLLIPGSYASVEVMQAKPQSAPLVAVQSVQTDANGQFVLVVDTSNKVQETRVTLGRQIGQDYIVKSGLKRGDRVIVEGIQKVHPGEVVAASQAQAAPQAPDSTVPDSTVPDSTVKDNTVKDGG